MSRWDKANWTEHQSLDEVLVRDVEVLDVYSFVSLLGLGFVLRYPRKVSVIGAEVRSRWGGVCSVLEVKVRSSAQVFVMPCLTSHLLRNLQYLDLSNNLLTDLTLTETLCEGHGPLKDLRVLNVSGNALKVRSRLLDPGPCETFVPLCSSPCPPPPACWPGSSG